MFPELCTVLSVLPNPVVDPGVSGVDVSGFPQSDFVRHLGLMLLMRLLTRSVLLCLRWGAPAASATWAWR